MGSLHLDLLPPFAVVGPIDVFWLLPFGFFKILELVLLFVGLKALLLGSLGTGGGREATGIGARVAALILILALPASLLIQFASLQDTEEMFVLGFYWNGGMIWVDLGFVVGCAMVGFMIASAVASSQGITGDYRHGTSTRGDIYVPKSDGRSLPGKKKKARRPSRPRRQEKIEEPDIVKEEEELEEVEEAEAPARRRKRPVRRQEEDEYEEDDYEDEEDDFRSRRRSRRVLLIVLAICVPLVLLLGGLILFLVLNSTSLKQYEFGDPGRKFRVRMPEGASTDAKDLSVSAKESNGLHYLLKVREVEPPDGIDARQEWLDGYDRVLAKDGLTVTDEKRTLWDSDNPGRLLEGNVTDEATRFRARIWLVEDRIYFLIVRGPASEIKSSDVTRFLDSLELEYHPRSR